MGEHVAYCIGTQDSPDSCLGVEVLKGDDHIARLASDGFSRAFVAIGSNEIRGKLAALAVENGFVLVNAISPMAFISPSASIGQGVAIMAGVVINASSHIGDLSIINTGAVVDHDCQIGYATHIGPQSALAGNVRVDDYAFLGIGAKVIPGVTIGKSAIIGAGSVVLKDVREFVTVAGVPAKRLKNSGSELSE